jgi:hypothetical protein
VDENTLIFMINQDVYTPYGQFGIGAACVT